LLIGDKVLPGAELVSEGSPESNGACADEGIAASVVAALLVLLDASNSVAADLVGEINAETSASLRLDGSNSRREIVEGAAGEAVSYGGRGLSATGHALSDERWGSGGRGEPRGLAMSISAAGARNVCTLEAVDGAALLDRGLEHVSSVAALVEVGVVA